MRTAIASILAGGMLLLGACSTSGEPDSLALAGRNQECMGPGTMLKPTGRHTGNPRNDYECVSVHARADRNGVTSAGAQRSMGIDRAARNGG